MPTSQYLSIPDPLGFNGLGITNWQTYGAFRHSSPRDFSGSGKSGPRRGSLNPTTPKSAED
jgi:hypothetical protein